MGGARVARASKCYHFPSAGPLDPLDPPGDRRELEDVPGPGELKAGAEIEGAAYVPEEDETTGLRECNELFKVIRVLENPTKWKPPGWAQADAQKLLSRMFDRDIDPSLREFQDEGNDKLQAVQLLKYIRATTVQAKEAFKYIISIHI